MSKEQLSVGNSIKALALINIQDIFRFTLTAKDEEIKERLALFDASPLIDKQVGDLSGGELQRVLLTIACTPVPNLLILDEPVSGIDRNGRKLFYKILNELKA